MSGRWQVSAAGGARPLWSRRGDELFYTSLDGAVLSASVGRTASFNAGTAEVVITAGYVTSPPGNNGRNFDVTADGQRFLMVKDADDATQRSATVVVVQHFFEELKRLAPAGR